MILAGERIRTLYRAISLLPETVAKIDEIGLAPRRNTPPFPVWDASEPVVRATFSDLVKPADTVFDVGAHIGGLSSVLSRIVGPNGKVIAFEASARTAAQLNANMVVNGHHNVFIFHGAVYSRPGMLVSLRDDGAASRIADDGIELVETIQLDDICRAHKLTPAFVKMDIEGAEFDALSGAEQLLGEVRPHIVFEHNIGDDRALSLIRKFNYITFDAARYVPVASSCDFESATTSANIVAVHKDRINNTPYRTLPVVSLVDELSPAIDGSVAIFSKLLEPGRYVFEVMAGPAATDAHTLYSRVTFDGTTIGQLWTAADFFLRNHRCLAFQARYPGKYNFEVGEVSSSTGAVKGFGARIQRVQLAS